MKHMLPAAALLLTSTAAYAELAPADIINSWRSYYENFGMAFSTDAPEVTGNTTRYTNITTSMNIGAGEIQSVYEWIDLRRNEDGSVDITFSPNGHSSSSAEVPGGTVTSTASFDLGSLIMHAQGEPDDIRLSYSAPIVTMQQTQNMPEAELSMTIVMENMQGDMRSVSSPDGAIAQSGTLSSGAFRLKASSTDAQTAAPAYIAYQTDTMRLNYDMDMPHNPVINLSQPLLSMFSEGAVIGMAVAAGPATLTVDKKTPGGNGRFTFTQESGDLTFAYAENALSYGLAATGATFGIASTPARSTDASVAFEGLHFGITLPVRKADTPAPFALSMALQGFTMQDKVWALFDPEATLSHAPASLSFSLNGTAKLFVDLFDQSAMTALRGAPFELRAMSLSGLSLDIEGLGLTGNGGVTFDNTRMDPMSGLPEPTGALDFSITGALALLDKIGRLGIGDPMFVIGAKGALGMFATAGDSPDSFTSHIDFTDGGHISINGQQVK